MNQIKKLLKIKNIQQKELATHIGVSPNTLSQYINEKRKMDYDILNKIAKYLNTTVDFLIGNTDMVVCEECGFGRNPLNESTEKEHDEFHKRYLTIKKSFPKLMTFIQASKVIADYTQKPHLKLMHQNCPITELDALRNYIEARYSMHCSQNTYQNILPYEYFYKNEIVTMHLMFSISNEVFEILDNGYDISKEPDIINLSDKTIPTQPEKKIYYFDDDARKVAQFMFDNPEYKVLFKAIEKVKKEDIQFVEDFINKLDR